MSKQAMSNRKVPPSRRDLRNELSIREMSAEYREGVGSWANYLIETGRAYQ